MDDFSADTDTAGRLEIGGRATGALESPGDEDWFATELEAGVEIFMSLLGQDGDGGTLPDPYLRIYDAAGTLLSSRDDTEGRDPRLYFTPDRDGIHYVAAAGYESSSGSYTLAAEAASADVPGRPDTDAVLTFGETVTSDFRSDDDSDWFAFGGMAGDLYQVDLSVPGAASARYWYLEASLLDADGAYVDGVYFDDYGSPDSDALGPIRFSVPEDGRYVLALYGSASLGDYDLTLARADDIDGELPGDGSTDAVIGVNEQRRSTFDFSGDRDALTVMLSAGNSYRIAADPFRSDYFTTADDVRIEVRDPGGAVVAQASGAFGDAAVIDTFTAAETGSYLIVAEADLGSFAPAESYVASILGYGVIAAEGSAADDTLRGGAGGDDLSGGGGNDLMVASFGDDRIDGGAGDDALFGQQGRDIISGGAGDDHIAGAGGADRIDGGAGDDLIGGGVGADRIGGGAGNDSIYSGPGSDTVRGGGGDDVIGASYGADLVVAASGEDDVGGGFGSDTIYAGRGADTVGAGEGADTVLLGVGTISAAAAGATTSCSGVPATTRSWAPGGTTNCAGAPVRTASTGAGATTASRAAPETTR